jgi:hypothetical protein
LDVCCCRCQVVVSFIILVPAGMAADVARKTQSVVNQVQVGARLIRCVIFLLWSCSTASVLLLQHSGPQWHPPASATNCILALRVDNCTTNQGLYVIRPHTSTCTSAGCGSACLPWC